MQPTEELQLVYRVEDGLFVSLRSESEVHPGARPEADECDPRRADAHTDPADDRLEEVDDGGALHREGRVHHKDDVRHHWTLCTSNNCGIDNFVCTIAD